MFQIREIEKVTQGRLLQGNVNSPIKGVSINSKTTKRGDVFIAIIGERFDGHSFIRQAVRRGASAVIVSKKVSAAVKNVAVIKVRDTVQALGQLARHHRDRFDIPVIAITGSAGKTTTKEMLTTVLKSRYTVLSSKGTQNNHIGVPLTLLGLNKRHKIVVVELGTNRPGDIAWLGEVTHPTGVIFTNIGESHLQRLKNKASVFQEKTSLLKFMAKRPFVIYNKDDRYLRNIRKKAKNARLISYGIKSAAQFRATGINCIRRLQTHFTLNGKQKFIIKTPVYSYVYNAIAAICCGRLFNISYNNINININKIKIPPGRQQISRIGGCWLIDDTYNANPVSFKSAIDTLALFQGGRKILVCSDMLELGGKAKDLHHAIGKAAANTGLDLVLTWGSHARHISDAARLKGGQPGVKHCSTLGQLNRTLLEYCRTGDVILVKASRSRKLERTINFLQNHLGA